MYEEDISFARLLMYSALEGDRFSEIFFESKCSEITDYLVRRIDLLIKEGTFRQIDSELAARGFMGMISNYCVMQEIYDFKKVFHRSSEHVVESFVGLYLTGMIKQGATHGG